MKTRLVKSNVKRNGKRHQKQKHGRKQSLRKSTADIFALSILIEVSTRKTDLVQEPVKGTFNVRV
jgi:hypothetical protein